MVATAVYSVTMALWKETAFPLYYYYYYCPVAGQVADMPSGRQLNSPTTTVNILQENHRQKGVVGSKS